jgi:hypothetical protein
MFTLVMGVIVCSGAGYLAANIGEVGASIFRYYKNLALFDRGPGPLAWQLKPNETQALVMAWLLVGASTALGLTFIGIGLAKVID